MKNLGGGGQPPEDEMGDETSAFLGKIHFTLSII